nr:hypothetical protein [Tanacetum cinerariifolium]
MASFNVLETQFLMFIKSWIYLDDEYVVMTRNYFLQYTQLEILEFRDTLIQHMESVKKSIDKRAIHKREYDSRVIERQMQTIEGKADTCKVLDASLVDIESSGTESKEHDTSSRLGNDAHADDAYIRPIYDEEPMAKARRVDGRINCKLTGHVYRVKAQVIQSPTRKRNQCINTLHSIVEESVKRSIDERVQLKREYDSWVNERQMQTTKEKVDTSKALDASSVDTESSRTESKEQDASNRSRNDAHDDVADIRPIYDEEPMAEVQTTAEINVFAIGQQHAEQPEFNNEREVVQNAKECHDTYPFLAIVTDNQIPKHSYQSLESDNSCLKKIVA